MTAKRFYMDKSGDLYDRENKSVMVDFGYSYDGVGCKRIIDLLNELNDENQHIKQTIKDMMENERTELGQSVLRQLWEAIQ